MTNLLLFLVLQLPLNSNNRTFILIYRSWGVHEPFIAPTVICTEKSDYSFITNVLLKDSIIYYPKSPINYFIINDKAYTSVDTIFFNTFPKRFDEQTSLNFSIVIYRDGDIAQKIQVLSEKELIFYFKEINDKFDRVNEITISILKEGLENLICLINHKSGNCWDVDE